jgi:hypothetical protein
MFSQPFFWNDSNWTTPWQAANQQSMVIQNTNTTPGNWSEIIFNDTAGIGDAAIGVQFQQTSGSAGNMAFATRALGGPLQTSLFIQSNSFVGIRTNLPQQALHVHGNAQIDNGSVLTLNSSSGTTPWQAAAQMCFSLQNVSNTSSNWSEILFADSRTPDIDVCENVRFLPHRASRIV